MAAERRGVGARLASYVVEPTREMPQRVDVALLHALAQAVRSRPCEDGGVRQEVGSVVAIPRDDAPPPSGPPSLERLSRWYNLYRGSAPVSDELKEALVGRRQQIEQGEIIGTVAPYLSVPRLLAGRDVLHWVDDTSAIAAMTTGYSSRPGSARLVHALHAWCAATRTSIWLEYVPSAANAADEPSRDMSLATAPYVPAPGLCSEPVRLVLPQVAGLAGLGACARAAGWLRGGLDGWEAAGGRGGL